MLKRPPPKPLRGKQINKSLLNLTNSVRESNKDLKGSCCRAICLFPFSFKKKTKKPQQMAEMAVMIEICNSKQRFVTSQTHSSPARSILGFASNCNFLPFKLHRPQTGCVGRSAWRWPACERRRAGEGEKCARKAKSSTLTTLRVPQLAPSCADLTSTGGRTRLLWSELHAKCGR